MAMRSVVMSPRMFPVRPTSTRSRPRSEPLTVPRITISRASTSAEILPCGPIVTRPSTTWIEPCTSPLITNEDVTIPPEGCTTSAVIPATLRTGSGRGGAGTSETGDDGLGSSGLRHMGSSQPKLRSQGAGATAKQPGEDGRLRTIIYANTAVYGLLFLGAKCFQTGTGADCSRNATRERVKDLSAPK